MTHSPVIYKTVDQHGINEDTYADGVYSVESNFFAFTYKLGVLRLHTQKVEENLATEYPWLRRARNPTEEVEPATDVCAAVWTDDAVGMRSTPREG